MSAFLTILDADDPNHEIARKPNSLFGWPEYYSDRGDDGSLFLTQARWYYRDESDTLVDRLVCKPGILVCCSNDIDFVQFQEPAVVDAARGTIDETYPAEAVSKGK